MNSQDDSNIKDETVEESEIENVKSPVTIEVEPLLLGPEGLLEGLILDDGTRVDIKIKPSDSAYEAIAAASSATSGVSSYFNSVAWVTWGGDVSLCVDAKTAVRESASEMYKAWDALKSSYSSSSKWKNTTVMKWQFECHFSAASYQQYWHLEPHRTASSYAALFLKKCNP